MSAFTSKYKSTPTFSFKSKTHSITSENRPEKFPSPNLYNPQKLSLKKQPSINFPKSKRTQWKQIKQKNWTPGPGTHQSRSYTTDGPSKTISKYRYQHKVSPTPSPNAYHNESLNLKFQNPSYTMPTKSISNQEILKKMNSYKPSPNQYNQDQSKYTQFQKSLQFSIGKSKRPANINSAKTPGPGQYNADASFTKSVSTSSKCKLGKQKRNPNFSLGQRSPGPGRYDNNSSFEDNKKKVKGFSCRAKTKSKNLLEGVPGPGQYQSPLNNKFKSSPLLRVPKSSRPCFTDKKSQQVSYIPGPGSHQLQSFSVNNKFKSLSVHKFSKAKANYQIQKRSMSNLSPLTYNVNRSLLENKGPNFSIDRRQKKGLKLGKIDKVPGPSEYQPNEMLTTKSQMVCMIPQSSRPNMVKHLMNNPGPGSYVREQQEQSKGRKFKFSKAPRGNINDDRIKKTKSTIRQSYQDRQTFPNPPKYMGVKPKMQYNQKVIKKY